MTEEQVRLYTYSREPDLGEWLAAKSVSDTKHLWVYPLLFGAARLCIGDRIHNGVLDDEWRYETVQEAIAAMNQWDGVGEPEGWLRHPSSGRRRMNGDPMREYIQP